jgi:hypothetical protein
MIKLITESNIYVPVGTELVNDGVLILGRGEGARHHGAEALLLALQDLPAVLQARHARVPRRQSTLAAEKGTVKQS